MINLKSHNIIFLIPPSCFVKRYSQDENLELIFVGVIPDDMVNTLCVVNELNHDFFREKLVKHFYIQWQNDDVFWQRKFKN